MQPSDVRQKHLRRVTIGDRQADGLMDSGATLIWSDQRICSGMQVTMPDGGPRSLQVARVFLDWGSGRGMREVGVLPGLDAAVLLGNDLGHVTCVFTAELAPVAAIPRSQSSGITAEPNPVPLHLGPTVPAVSAETRQFSNATHVACHGIPVTSADSRTRRSRETGFLGTSRRG
ncbi:hypothetical protein FKM82_028451 [Ascaphus truei]